MSAPFDRQSGGYLNDIDIDIPPFDGVDKPRISPSTSMTNMTPDNTHPHSSLVGAMLTDLYQITMAYAYWTSGRHMTEAVFDCFFRTHPFQGEFTIFAGLEETLRFVHTFRFTTNDIAALKKRFPDWKPAFWTFLSELRTDAVRIYAIDEGTIVIPRIPLIRVEGPLAVCQLLETTILVLVNFASLVATNAARHRLAVGPHKTLLEFGLRRAQGPDGAVTASRYAYIGGFDGTSNVKASMMFGIPLQGTHAHSFVSSFDSMNDIGTRTLTTNPHPLAPTAPTPTDDHTAESKSFAGRDSTVSEVKQADTTPGAAIETRDFVNAVLLWRSKIGRLNTNEGELAAFTAYAIAFPNSFLSLVDTYDALQSGVINFLVVALALYDFGYLARGIRLDSGDLAYLSRESRKLFKKYSELYNVPFTHLTIVASNDLSEQVLFSLREQGHEIDSFAVGTHLVTCKNQPALGCVYKLVSCEDKPRIKVSHDSSKITIPGRKDAYRLFNSKGEAILDLLIATGTSAPVPFKRILCRHPFDANKRVYVTPSRVVPLHTCVWDGRLTKPFVSLRDIRNRVAEQLSTFREDHLRRLNPTPYKLSVTSDLYTFMHDLWLSETPIAELK